MKANLSTGLFLSLLLIATLAQQAADSLATKVASPTNTQPPPGFKVIWPESAEGFKLLQKQAEQGDAESQLSLGWCYYFGEGVTKDAGEAAKWFRKAAEQGCAPAQSNLGVLYEQGDGVPQDYAEAVKWYRRAALSGNSGAQHNLGLIFYRGIGVPQDFIEAYKWFNLAAAQGNTNSVEFRRAIQSVMTSAQIAEGQRRSSAAVIQKNRLPSSVPDVPYPETKNAFQIVLRATGTGFFITEDGFLITNEHVAKGAARIRLVIATGAVDATVVKVDAANDIALLKAGADFAPRDIFDRLNPPKGSALLKAKGKFTPLPIATSRTAKLGNTVTTVGFPNIGLQGFAPKLAKGEIASLSGAQDDPRYFQISVPVQPGNSGGALVDERGNVVGVVSAKLNAMAALAASGALPENVNYAVKSSFLLSFLESVPEVSAKLKEPETKDRRFEDVVKSAEQAAVLVLVY